MNFCKKRYACSSLFVRNTFMSMMTKTSPHLYLVMPIKSWTTFPDISIVGLLPQLPLASTIKMRCCYLFMEVKYVAYVHVSVITSTWEEKSTAESRRECYTRNKRNHIWNWKGKLNKGAWYDVGRVRNTRNVLVSPTMFLKTEYFIRNKST